MSRRDPQLEVLPDPASLAERAVEQFRDDAAAAIGKRGRFTVALSGGSTPRALYALLASQPFSHEIDWARTHVFWSDERCVPPDHPDSNYRMAADTLLNHVPVPVDQIHRMRGELAAPQQAARDYADELRTVFGRVAPPCFDLLLLGLGEDGHTASLFPGVAVPEDDVTLTAAVYVPTLNMWRLTLTLTVLNAAARVLFLVEGASKADALKVLIAGPRSLHLPAQRVRPVNGSLVVLADQAAASALSKS